MAFAADVKKSAIITEQPASAATAYLQLNLFSVSNATPCSAGVYSRMQQGVEAFAADVEKVCYLYQAASKRSHSTFAAELGSQQAAAMADLVLDRMAELMSQRSGVAGTEQAPTPENKLKKKTGEESPDSPEDGAQDDKQINIVEDIERLVVRICKSVSRLCVEPLEQLHRCSSCGFNMAGSDVAAHTILLDQRIAPICCRPFTLQPVSQCV